MRERNERKEKTFTPERVLLRDVNVLINDLRKRIVTNGFVPR